MLLWEMLLPRLLSILPDDDLVPSPETAAGAMTTFIVATLPLSFGPPAPTVCWFWLPADFLKGFEIMCHAVFAARLTWATLPGTSSTTGGMMIGWGDGWL